MQLKQKQKEINNELSVKISTFKAFLDKAASNLEVINITLQYNHMKKNEFILKYFIRKSKNSADRSQLQERNSIFN